MQSLYEPLERVDILFIGLGQRGMSTLRRMMLINGIEVVGLCDLSDNARSEAQDVCTLFAFRPKEFVDWQRAIDESPANLVVISTDWDSHAKIAVAAMRSGKDVAIEVPAAMTLEDCNDLVATAQRFNRRCTMLENCCYDPFALRTLTMARRGVFGELTHFEGAYIHDLRKLYAENRWYGKSGFAHGGNPYPTHGVGPICQLLDACCGGDRLKSLVSLTATAAKGCAPLNTTLIATEQGRTILLDHDVSTPRPYSRKQTVCGSTAYISKYPVETFMSDATGMLQGRELREFMDGYKHEIELAYEADAERLGVENRMNYYMDRRLIDAMLRGTAMDISVVDAAIWSSLTELTQQSAKSGGCPVDIPRFDA